jgi:acylaminoacyl-peptidase
MNAFFHEMQVMASAGSFVFYCNPRGGSSRGDGFAALNGRYGTIDYDDLMEFTDNVLEKYPAIDRNRLGVTGGSYGGFMTNWIIGHTDRFAAAASCRSIASWAGFSMVSDIGPSFAAYEQGGTLWENPDKQWWHSPLKYADNFKTPTLIVHSFEDYRCCMPEAMQMYQALIAKGVDARMWLCKGENHELSRSGKPKHRVRRLEEITGWLFKYLKPQEAAK